MKVEMKLKPFTVSNFVIVETPPGRKQDGFVEAPKFHISDLSVETLEELCAKFREDVLAKKTAGRE